VQSVIAKRCAPCHSLQPTMPGISAPPAGIVLDTRAKIERLAPLIKTVAVDSHLMPPSNATHMSQGERDLLARWLAHR
jgi:uncharacterized membrane protein